MLGDNDTIAAIGTARGVGALGIVRMSGPATEKIVTRCFKGKAPDFQESHKAAFGLWENPSTSSPVDEVVLLYFAAGRGYTGEPSVDIICHGGIQVTELVLEAALAGGARLARPGEFTYRAVMNNKLDLARAESVLDLIRAKTPRAAAQALHNIRGALSEKLSAAENAIIFVLANLEAAIDFTTEDIQPVNFAEMGSRVSGVTEQIQALVRSHVAARVVSQGLKMVLAGRPNAGKSSLLNRLVGKSRSIVTDTPGTTRDTVEEEVLFDGHLFRFIDTAGLRQAENEVEKQGIDRTHQEINAADVLLYVVDSGAGLSNDDVEQLNKSDTTSTLVCFNKSDLKRTNPDVAFSKFGLTRFTAVTCSTLDERGLIELREAIVNFAKRATTGEMSSVVSTQRQKEGLDASLAALKRAEDLLAAEVSPELVAFELKDALLKIQSILGKDAGDDVMDRVFKEFCIGK